MRSIFYKLKKYPFYSHSDKCLIVFLTQFDHKHTFASVFFKFHSQQSSSHDFAFIIQEVNIDDWINLLDASEALSSIRFQFNFSLNLMEGPYNIIDN